MSLIIGVKTLQNKRFDFEIDANVSIYQFKQKIENELMGYRGINFAQCMKLIHYGKILKNDQIVGSVFEQKEPNQYNQGTDWVVVLPCNLSVRLEIDDKCYISNIYYKKDVEKLRTFKNFQSEIAKKLDEEVVVFSTYYDLFVDGKPFRIKNDDNEWWSGRKSVNIQIRSKNNKFSHEYDKLISELKYKKLYGSWFIEWH